MHQLSLIINGILESRGPDCRECMVVTQIQIGYSHSYDTKGIVNLLRISLHWALYIYQKVGIWNPELYDYLRLHDH